MNRGRRVAGARVVFAVGVTLAVLGLVMFSVADQQGCDFMSVDETSCSEFWDVSMTISLGLMLLGLLLVVVGGAAGVVRRLNSRDNR